MILGFGWGPFLDVSMKRRHLPTYAHLAHKHYGGWELGLWLPRLFTLRVIYWRRDVTPVSTDPTSAGA